jgi:hypothetical protein
MDQTRVAKWYSFTQKIPIWVYFVGPWSGDCWYSFEPFGNFVVIWYFNPCLGIFYLEKSGNPGPNCREAVRSKQLVMNQPQLQRQRYKN